MINLDITLLIQVFNFLLGLAIINYLIVRPIRAVIARRSAMNAGQKAENDGLMASADQKLEGYNARLEQARAEVAAVKESIRSAAQKNAQEQLAEAGETSRRILGEASDRIRRECAQAQGELDAKVGGYVQIALKSMLG